MSMEITFPGGLRVAANYKNFEILTDQPKSSGGNNSAPSPFDLFLSSLGACAGFFALKFCTQRNINAGGLRLTLETESNPEKHLISKIKIIVFLPDDFPDKYSSAILKAVDQCTVKRHMLTPPEFEVLVGKE